MMMQHRRHFSSHEESAEEIEKRIRDKMSKDNKASKNGKVAEDIEKEE